MKTKLSLTIDTQLLAQVERRAVARGVTLAAVVEEALRLILEQDSEPSFVDRWRGAMRLADRGDARYRDLATKYR